MMEPFAELEELRRLLDALCEESITSEQMRRLEELILERPEAEAFYVQYMSLHAELQRQFSVLPAKTEELLRRKADSATHARSPVFSRRSWIVGGALTLTAAAAILVAFLLRSGPEERITVAEPPAEPTHDSVAVILAAPKATWRKSNLRAGSALVPGTLHLESGHAQIEFYSGARVTLEGPAEFEIISRNEAFCRRGKLRALIPPHAQGFTIITPTLNLVDRGTEFGVDVGDAKTEVHVFQGKVELFDPTAEKPALRKELTTGQGIRTDETGKLNPIRSKPESFLSADQLAKQADEATLRQKKSWLSASEELRTDPSLLVYFTFEGNQPWSRTLTDRALDGKHARHGAIVGCSWGPGRWPGKSGLEFKRVSDRVRVNVPGEFDSMTLMTWVRVDSLPNGNNSLFMADGWESGEPHWQIGNDGKLILGVQSNPRKGSHYHAAEVLTPARFGQWVHLATVYDGEQGEVSHYVDGISVAQQPVQLEVKLCVGEAELGNWNVATHRNSTPIRNLNGSMDEFLLFSRALDAAEIERLYQSGRPPY